MPPWYNTINSKHVSIVKKEKQQMLLDDNNSQYNFDNVLPEWTYDNLTEARKAYVDRILEFGESHGIDLTEMVFSRQQLKKVSLSFKDNDDVPNWIVKDHDRRARQGVYTIPEVVEKFTGESPLINMTLVVEDDDETMTSDEVFVFEPEMLEQI
jgi:hypothetical protein